MKKLLLFFVLSLFTRHAFAAPFEAPIIFRKVISNSVGSVVLGDRDQGIVAYFRSRGWLYTPNHETVNKVNTQSFQTDVINPQAPDLLPNSYPENLIAADKNSSYWATTFHRQTNPSSWSENDILFQFYNGAELIYETILPLGSDYNANCHNMKFVDLAESATKRLIMLCRVGSTENIVVVDYNENPSPGDEQVNINYKAINHAVMYGNAISEKGTIAMVEGSQLKIIDVTSNSQGTIEFKQFWSDWNFFPGMGPHKMAISDDGNTILWHVSNLVWILKRCEESGCNHYVKTQLEIPALGNFRKKWRRSDLSKDGNAIGLLAENIDYSGQQILAYRLKQNGTIDGPPIVNKEWRDTAVDVCSHQVGKIMFSPDGKWLFGASLGNCTANIPSLFGFRVDNARDSFEEFPAYTGNAQVLDFDIRGNKIAYTVWGFGGGVGLFIRELP